MLFCSWFQPCKKFHYGLLIENGIILNYYVFSFVFSSFRSLFIEIIRVSGTFGKVFCIIGGFGALGPCVKILICIL